MSRPAQSEPALVNGSDIEQTRSGTAPNKAGAAPIRAATAGKSVAAIVAGIIGFVLWAHFASGFSTFRSQVPAETGWERFRDVHGLRHFGQDGQFVRAVQSGYNLFFHTYRYAPRFTRNRPDTTASACASCHTTEDLAYAFVNSDRVDAKVGRRLSFEDEVRRCYANGLNGFVPTIYDPAVRDIRLLARAVAHHLQLTEGALPDPARAAGVPSPEKIH